MPASVAWPSDSGAPRWQQRSSRAQISPRPFLKRTTGSLSSVRASGLSAISAHAAATYQALRTNMIALPALTKRTRLRRRLLAVGGDALIDQRHLGVDRRVAQALLPGNQLHQLVGAFD